MPSAPILGTVTKTNSGMFPYTARYGDGGTAGSFKTVRDAQIPIEQALGGKLLRWTREDLLGDVEFWKAERP